MMSGLLLDNFYKTISGMRILLALLVVIGAFLIAFIDDNWMLQAYIFAIFLGISAVSLFSIRKDLESRWHCYEIILPVKRKKIILCKYISYLFWVLVSILMALIYTGIIITIKGNFIFDFGMRDILTFFTISISLTLQIGSVFYMGLYLLGLEKSDVLMIISVIAAIALTGLSAGFLNKKGVSIESGRIMILGASVLWFGLSYPVTKFLYEHSEF